MTTASSTQPHVLELDVVLAEPWSSWWWDGTWSWSRCARVVVVGGTVVVVVGSVVGGTVVVVGAIEVVVTGVVVVVVSWAAARSRQDAEQHRGTRNREEQRGCAA